MGNVNGVVGIDEKLEHIVVLCLVGIVKFFEGLHLRYVAGVHADEFSVVITVRENKLERTAHIEERRIVPTVGLARLLRFDTSDDVVISCVLDGKSAAEKRGDVDFVVLVGR